MQEEELATQVIHEAYQIHRDLGPGLLESVYEVILSRRLQRLGLRVETQVPMSFDFDGLHIEKGFRVDLLVEGALIVETKSVELLKSRHAMQLLTYLRLARFPLGLLLNFGGPVFRDGCRRVVNDYRVPPSIGAEWGKRGNLDRG